MNMPISTKEDLAENSSTDLQDRKMIDIQKYLDKSPALADVLKLKPTVWLNPNLMPASQAWDEISFSLEDIIDADQRLRRFAPLLMEYFPDTRADGGLIESELREIPEMAGSLSSQSDFQGRLFLKMDSHLPVGGSVKARGGIYEVLHYAEQLAMEHNLLKEEDNYSVLAQPEQRKLFSQYTIQVGSTGNLGLSIGIISSALAFKVIVHMSADAKQWKKDLLRSKGVVVKEYAGDFSAAVAQGRADSLADSGSYFVDDENSVNLFLGYAVAALRIKEQMRQLDILPTNNRPAIFYIPCGVGGAPGGITFGLKKLFGDAVHVFFVEPTHVPGMLLGMATGLHNEISVKDFGLDGKTEADGLAVGRSSGFVGRLMEPLLSGIFTIEDADLFTYLRALDQREQIRIEPSAAAAFAGPVGLFRYESAKRYLAELQLADTHDIIHVVWATGGNLVPAEIMNAYLA